MDDIARELVRRLELPTRVTEGDDPHAWPDGLLVVAGEHALVAIPLANGAAAVAAP